MPSTRRLAAAAAVLAGVLLAAPGGARADTVYLKRTPALKAAVDGRMGSAEGKELKLLGKASAALDLEPWDFSLAKELRALERAARFLVSIEAHGGPAVPPELASSFGALRSDMDGEMEVFAGALGGTPDPRHPGSSIPVPASVGRSLEAAGDHGLPLHVRTKHLSRALRTMLRTHKKLWQRKVYGIECLLNDEPFRSKSHSSSAEIDGGDGHLVWLAVGGTTAGKSRQVGVELWDRREFAGPTIQGPGTYTVNANFASAAWKGGYDEDGWGTLVLVRYSAAQRYAEGTFEFETSETSVEDGVFRAYLSRLL